MLYSAVRTVLAVACCLLLVSAVVVAQEHSDYRLFGKVTDSKGQPVAGARIILKEKTSGKGTTIKTKDDGTFDQQFVPHGVYGVTIEKEGFAPRTIETMDLSATADQTIQRKIDVVLVTPQEEEAYKKQQESAKMDQQIQADYKRGVQAFQAKDYDQAISIMQDLTKKSPDSYGPYLVLGAAHHAKGDCDTAIENYLKAVSLKKDVPDAYRYMGDCYTQKKQYQQAVDSYTKLLELQPNDTETRCVMANILSAALDKSEEAATEVAKGLQQDPNVAICHKTNAELLFKKGNMKEAAAEFRKYLELQPDAPDKAQIADILKAIEQSK